MKGGGGQEVLKDEKEMDLEISPFINHNWTWKELKMHMDGQIIYKM